MKDHVGFAGTVGIYMHAYIFRKANSLACREANSDEYGGPFHCFTVLSFNGCGPHCPYMVEV